MRLKDWLKWTTIPISKFADLIGINRSYLHKIMKGKHTPSDRVMFKIVRVTSGKVGEKEELINETKSCGGDDKNVSNSEPNSKIARISQD